MAITVEMKNVPELDPGFVPAVLWNREFRRLAKESGGGPVAVAVERNGGHVARFDLLILPDTAENLALNLRYIERLVKFVLWSRGGWRVVIGGSPRIAGALRRLYSPGGERAFDCKVMGRTIYDHDFTVESCSLEDTPAEADTEVRLGGHFGGCRIGFDLGGSDRKCAAVQDGVTLHSEEVVWDPYFQKDIAYHREGVLDSLRRAAAHLPRVDFIGGSAAGVYVDNQPRIASLFRGIPEEEFASSARPLFLEIAKEFPGVPFTVINDGEVTALAGALSIKENGLLGIAMGTSEAVGFVTPQGNLTDYLNELAFAPVDYRETDAPRDEWSGDFGVGANYLSQQAVGRLAPKAGFDFGEKTPFPEQLKQLQAAMKENDPRALLVYRTIGRYLGYAIAHYADFYAVKHILLLGRVSSGAGGDLIISEARRVLGEEFRELFITFHIPDEAFKRHGQAVIAASLPE